MTLFLVAVTVVMGAVGFGLWLKNLESNTRLTDKLIATVATQMTWLFTTDEMAAILDVTPEKAHRLMTALPEDDSRYRVSEDGIRYWTTQGNWGQMLIAYLGEQALTCAVDYRGRIVTVDMLSQDLHNPAGTIMTVLQDLSSNPGTGNLAYNVGDDLRTIVVYGVFSEAR